jgi:uncharacterized lipoprotein
VVKNLFGASCLTLLAACSNSDVTGTPSLSSSWHQLGITRAMQSPPPAGWQFPYQPNPFVIPICASDPCSPQLDPNSASRVSQMMMFYF